MDNLWEFAYSHLLSVLSGAPPKGHQWLPRITLEEPGELWLFRLKGNCTTLSLWISSSQIKLWMVGSPRLTNRLTDERTNWLIDLRQTDLLTDSPTGLFGLTVERSWLCDKCEVLKCKLSLNWCTEREEAAAGYWLHMSLSRMMGSILRLFLLCIVWLA